MLCAAKLLHDTMFGTNDPGIYRFVEGFEQESQFLRMIKHPNIVQFLGTLRDPKTRRLALLMELMDESPTRFLERSTGPLPYHTQLNICNDVALALAYLHSNNIIHRDLSSNNVLLIGEGSRAKVTDFGMSRLIGMNYHMSRNMTPLTMCPGTVAYMPPEALITPPRYSDKLDCFSHGVLTIQIITRQFPNPGDAHVEDANEETFRRVPETERRKKDIDLVDHDHPLLPLSLSCLKGKAKERPSANELCERLAALKCEIRYIFSVEESKEQGTLLSTLRQELKEKNGELERSRAERQIDLDEYRSRVEKICEEYKTELSKKEIMTEQVIADCHAQVQTHLEQLRMENRQLRQENRGLRQQVTATPDSNIPVS